MKICILNGGYVVIVYFLGLMDIYFVYEGMENLLVCVFLDKLEVEEIIFVVLFVFGIDLNVYYVKVVECCVNFKIGDMIWWLCFDGLNWQLKFIVLMINDWLVQGLLVDGLVLELVLWCCYCVGVIDSGVVIELNDLNWDWLIKVVNVVRDDVL